MNEENEAEGASAKRVPLTEAELAELVRLCSAVRRHGTVLGECGDEDLVFELTFPAMTELARKGLHALPALLAEVRRLRARVKWLELSDAERRDLEFRAAQAGHTKGNAP